MSTDAEAVDLTVASTTAASSSSYFKPKPLSVCGQLLLSPVHVFGYDFVCLFVLCRRP
jgi:hypothetical protein